MAGSFREALIIVILLSSSAYSQDVDANRIAFSEHVQKAQQFLREKHPDLAIPELQAAAALKPNDVAVEGDLGVLLYFQGKPDDAIPHLRKAVDLDPALAQMKGVLGLAELRTGDYGSARKDLEAAFPLIADKKVKTQIGLSLVGLYTQSGELDQAPPVLVSLLKTAPDSPEVLYASYRTFSDLAGESMLALSLRVPESAQMHQMIAHEEIRQGKTNEAIAEYRKALAIDPRLPGIHFELAELLRTGQDVTSKKEMDREYHAALAQDPRDEKSLCRLAELDAERGDFQRALEQFNQAVLLQPSDSNAKLGLAKTLIELNQNDKALIVLEEVVREEPTDATAHYRLGTMYRRLGRVDDAKREIATYKNLKELKDKLRARYKVLMIQPDEMRAEEDAHSSNR